MLKQQRATPQRKTCCILVCGTQFAPYFPVCILFCSAVALRQISSHLPYPTWCQTNRWHWAVGLKLLKLWIKGGIYHPSCHASDLQVILWSLAGYGILSGSRATGIKFRNGLFPHLAIFVCNVQYNDFIIF